jgi:hypothetical protein
MFHITTSSAVDVKLFSAFPSEDELLLPPGVPLRIAGSSMFNGIRMVQCQEVSGAPALVVGWNRAPPTGDGAVSQAGAANRGNEAAHEVYRHTSPPFNCKAVVL